jgi:kinesin family member 15
LKALREGNREGVYVENLISQNVSKSSDAYTLLKKGIQNRHTASTDMNHQSSRSHSVFTIIIKHTEKKEEGISKIRTSKLNLIDLAGSERQKSTNSEGERFKEGCYINKSLTVLGQVINGLVDISNGNQRHISYRDSKLTFLLRDSLGGNSETCIIANASPALINARETLSTLHFAQCAKFVKNKPIVNEDTSGTILGLQDEIKALKAEIEKFKKNGTTQSNQISSKFEIGINSEEKENLLQFMNEENITKCQLIKMSLNEVETTNSKYESEMKKIDLLRSLVESKNENVHQLKMILKLREAEILKLKGRKESINEFYFNEEETLTRIEKSIKKIFESNKHPSALEHALEYFEMKEKLDQFEDLKENMEKELTVNKEMKEYCDELKTELLNTIEHLNKGGYKKDLNEANEKIQNLELNEQNMKLKLKEIEEKNAILIKESTSFQSLFVKNNHLQQMYNQCVNEMENQKSSTQDLKSNFENQFLLNQKLEKYSNELLEKLNYVTNESNFKIEKLNNKLTLMNEKSLHLEKENEQLKNLLMNEQRCNQEKEAQLVHLNDSFQRELHLRNMNIEQLHSRVECALNQNLKMEETLENFEDDLNEKNSQIDLLTQKTIFLSNELTITKQALQNSTSKFTQVERRDDWMVELMKFKSENEVLRRKLNEMKSFENQNRFENKII